jgi:hypothetical protein
VTHLNDGQLRRLCDDPLAVPAGTREHVRSCTLCGARFDRIAETARVAATLLVVPDVPLDTARALARLRPRLGPVRRNASWATRLGVALRPGSARRRASATFGALGAAVLAIMLVLTPAGSFAASLFTVFQVRQFAPVPVSLSDLRVLPNLSHYGTMRLSHSSIIQTVASAADAAADARQSVLVPGPLPNDVPGTVSYTIAQPVTASFTFSAAKTRAAAARIGKSLPPMPAALDGSSLSITIGPVVLAMYGSTGSGLPALLLAQAPAPRVTSTGASTKVILDYLLKQPGISSQLAAQIRAIGDPSTTLPIPIPVDLAQGRTVRVRDAQGMVVGDNTGIGSAVVWTEHGLIHGAAGTLSEDELLAIVKGLH